MTDAVLPHGAAVPLLSPREGLPPVIETGEALDSAARALAAGSGPVAVDAERASGYRYRGRAYLVQLRRTGTGTVLIDPIACPDLSGLSAALSGAEAVLHAASQDLPCLAELGYRPRSLFDTELAGRLLGFPRVGLGTLVETVLGLLLEKRHSAADWSRRPLPEEWLRYAALDVEVLIELRDVLARMLTGQGKAEWARQEFAAVLAAEPAAPRPDPWRRTSGIHRVRSRRGLAVVRELWEQRDTIARKADLAPGRVLPDAAIVEAAGMAAAVPGGRGGHDGPAGPARQRPADLARIPGFSSRTARQHGPEWLEAVRRAHALPERALPEPAGTATAGNGGPGGLPPAHRWAERDPDAAARLSAARRAVTGLAEAHAVPAENLIPPGAVRRLTWDPPDPADAGAVARALSGYGARPWQVELTSGPIATALLDLAGTSPP